MARADDFKLGVQDAGLGYEYTGGTLGIPAFGTCPFDTSTTDGCVTIWNDTGVTITELIIDVPNDLVVQEDGGGACLIVDGCTSTLVDGETVYQFDFTGLDFLSGIGNGIGQDTLTIKEEGIAPGDFPAITLTATTPEPASLMLLATGLLLCAGFIYRRRMGADSLGM
jgi:hypothetical protein